MEPITLAALPTANGADMQGAYRQIFDTIHLDVTFTIDELEITSDHTAYALTRSNGTQTVLATMAGQPNPTERSSCSAAPTPAGRSPTTCSTNPHERHRPRIRRAERSRLNRSATASNPSAVTR